MLGFLLPKRKTRTDTVTCSRSFRTELYCTQIDAKTE